MDGKEFAVGTSHGVFVYKVKGAEEIVVGARKECTSLHHVEKGYIMRLARGENNKGADQKRKKTSKR